MDDRWIGSCAHMDAPMGVPASVGEAEYINAKKWRYVYEPESSWRDRKPRRLIVFKMARRNGWRASNDD
jgi:hypothetical protein